MKKIVFVCTTAIALAACGSNSAGKDAHHDSTQTASDTITNVTNPGVGSASDDTTARP